jgi:hypothetical protein
MRKLLTLMALVVFGSTLALAATFTGRLVDASCAQAQKGAACTPTASTSSFALESSGKMYKLDSAGNQKAADAMKSTTNSANRAQNEKATAEVTATINGTLSGEELKVDSIQVH